jgi:hypothetical protein
VNSSQYLETDYTEKPYFAPQKWGCCPNPGGVIRRSPDDIESAPELA